MMFCSPAGSAVGRTKSGTLAVDSLCTLSHCLADAGLTAAHRPHEALTLLDLQEQETAAVAAGTAKQAWQMGAGQPVDGVCNIGCQGPVG
jgi:hypothetical protein